MSCHTVKTALPSFLSARRPQAQRDIIFELRRIAFDAESEPNTSSGSMEKRKSMYTRDYKKLGFIVSNSVLPAPGAGLSRTARVLPERVVRLRLPEPFSHLPDV